MMDTKLDGIAGRAWRTMGNWPLGWIVFAVILLVASGLLYFAFRHFGAAADEALVVGLLGWPFLLSLILAVGAVFAGDRFLTMFETRKWSISKEGVSVEEEITQVEGTGLELAERVKKLEARLVAVEGGDAATGEDDDSPDIGGGDGSDVSGGGGIFNGDEGSSRAPTLSEIQNILSAKSVEDALGKLKVKRTGDGFEVSEDGEGSSLRDLIAQSAQRASSGQWSPPDELTTRIQRAISESRFEWRSIERLALESGVTTEQAHAALASRPKLFRIGKGASGRKIAKLR